MIASRVTAFIDVMTWTFAKSMPENPHYYCLREEARKKKLEPIFEAFVLLIRDLGYSEYYGGRKYTCLNINGWKYWTMGDPLKKTILINRCVRDYNTKYDLFAEEYKDHFKTKAHKEEDQVVLDLLQEADCTSCLDIGCGDGNIAREAFLDYYGIDPSKEMLPNTDDVACCTFEDYHTHDRYSAICSLYGSMSYVKASSLYKVNRLLGGEGKVFLMYYGKDYTPETHKVFNLSNMQRNSTAHDAMEKIDVDGLELFENFLDKYDLVTNICTTPQ